MAGLLSLAFLALTLVAATGAGAEVPAKDEAPVPSGPVVSWMEDGVPQSAWVALDEVAVVETGAGRVRLLHLSSPAATLDELRGRIAAAGRLGHGDGASVGRTVGAVLYAGDRSDGSRLVCVGDVAVRFRPGTGRAARKALAGGLNLGRAKKVSFSSGIYLYRAATPLDTFPALEVLAASPLVDWAAPSFLRTRSRRWSPNDPLFGAQWHLRNVGQQSGKAGQDVNVLPVWDQSVGGVPLRGTPEQVIAVTDDGLEVGHPDLAPNVIAGRSWDWADDDADPSPSREAKAGEFHGTSCAGVAAARGDNGLGVAGAAPFAGLIGYRFLVEGVDSDAVEAEALAAVKPDVANRDLVDVSSNSWGPLDDRHLEGPGPLAEAALKDGVRNGRGGLGIVYVWAAGNGRADQDNVNFDGFANSRYTLTVGASTSLGKVAPYSEDGAALMVVAPSSDGAGGSQRGIVTTDLSGSAGYSTGDYFTGFGGTSAAAPLVSGVAALVLQANPGLTWRDVQAVFMTTARMIDAGHKDWVRNAAGYHINHTYGFGLVDAEAAVAAARNWQPLGPERVVTASASPNANIPDGSPTGVTSAITLGAGTPRLKMEYVDVVLNAPHDYWHDLEVTLVAPSGTTSLLAPAAAPDAAKGDPGFIKWRFGSARHFGESSMGTWRLRVRDLYSSDRGRFVGWTLRVYGTEAPADTEPPVTRVLPERRWWNGPVKLRLVAVDVGSNVARTEMRTGPSATGPFERSTSVRFHATRANHAEDGRYNVWYRSVDNSGNVEPLRRFVVNIDTRRPTTKVLAPVRVQRGGVATVRFAVSDPGFSAGRAYVTVQVRRAGKVIKNLPVGWRATSRRDAYSFRSTLAPGAYSVRVLARDRAGNRQIEARPASFIVR